MVFNYLREKVIEMIIILIYTILSWLLSYMILQNHFLKQGQIHKTMMTKEAWSKRV